MSLHIRHSSPTDLASMQCIFGQARQKMIAAGNPHQWSADYPSDATLLSDIERGVSYIVERRGQPVATFVLAPGIEPTYRQIHQGSWLDDLSPYATIHRIASAHGEHGIADFVLRWAFTQVDNIRIDTHRLNLPMQHILRKHHFHYCGIIYLDDGDERLAYQCLNISTP